MSASNDGAMSTGAASPAQRRAVVAAVLALHAAAGSAVLQMRTAHEDAPAAVPLFFELVQPPAATTPPPALPTPPRPQTTKPLHPRPAFTTRTVPTPVSAARETVIATTSNAATSDAPPADQRAAAATAMATSPTPAPAAEPAATTAAAAPPAPPPALIPPSAVQYLQPVLPVYSQASARAREHGRVVARVFIDETGLPRDVSVDASSGYARLDDAWVAAVRRARFKPPTHDGRPMSGWALAAFEFQL